MTPKTIALMRLAQQRLTGDPLPAPAAVVSWLGAVQAQEYLDTLWSLRLRMAGATLAEVEQAFNDGAMLRTHAMRPTWHFVAPEDIRWLQALTGPRVHQQNGTIYRRLELDGALLARTDDILAAAVAYGRYRTRQELRADLAAAGIEAEGQRLAYIVMHAELEAVLCSGPRRGKQFTYALVAERAPQARTLARDEALAELTLRFFASHGPATARDMAWWSGLTLGEVREGLEMVAGALAYERFDGQRYWFSTAQPPAALANSEAMLLPTYDEFMIGYTAANRARIGGVETSDEILFYATIVLDGQVVGTWRRTFQKGVVRVELAPFAPLAAEQERAIVAAAERFAAFVELPLELEWLAG